MSQGVPADDAELFRNVAFLVEADDYARQTLWREHHYETPPDGVRVREWDQEFLGHMITLGTIDRRPVCVSLSYAKLNGKRVMFYEGCSQVVDHEMIRQWLLKHTKETIRWDGGTRWGHCNAMNFHLCLDALGVLDEHQRMKGSP